MFITEEEYLPYCRWNLRIYNCKDEEFYRSVYYIKIVLAVCVCLLDSVLIVYRLGIKRRNLINPYGIAPIDGLLIMTKIFACTMFYNAYELLKTREVKNYIMQEYSYQLQFIFALGAIQLYLTGILNASPRYQGSVFSYPRPKIINIISSLLFLIWASIEVVGIFIIGSKRKSSDLTHEEIKFPEMIDPVYTRWIKITNITLCVVCVLLFIVFFLFGLNLTKIAERSLEDMYRSKKIKPNVVAPIQMAIMKMKWMNGAFYVIMLFFALAFILYPFLEIEILSTFFSQLYCVSINILPPTFLFISLLSIVYGEARPELIPIFPSTHCDDEEYPMSYDLNTRQSMNSEVFGNYK